MTDTLRILYLNVNHTPHIQHNAIKVANKKDAHFLILTKPHYYPGMQNISAPGWNAYCSKWSAILIRHNIECARIVTNHPDITAMRTGRLNVIATYSSPSEDISYLVNPLKSLLTTLQSNETLLGGTSIAEQVSSQVTE